MSEEEAAMLLEVVVENAAGLEAAIIGGADRIELCSALDTGGITPPLALMKLAATAPIPVRALCRPRAGDFAYSEADMALLMADVTDALECGLEGVVIGAGTRTGLAGKQLAAILKHARTLRRVANTGFTLHRVFDTLDDMPAALEDAAALGFDTILTSGGARTAPEGAPVLEALVRQAADRIRILAGGGINVGAVPALCKAGVRQFHASCRVRSDQNSEPALVRLGYAPEKPWQTDVRTIAELKEAIALHQQNDPSGRS